MKKLKLVGILAAVVLIGGVISIPLINNHTAYKVEIIVFLFLTAPEKEEFMQVMIILGKYIFRTARIIQILHI